MSLLFFYSALSLIHFDSLSLFSHLELLLSAHHFFFLTDLTKATDSLLISSKLPILPPILLPYSSRLSSTDPSSLSFSSSFILKSLKPISPKATSSRWSWSRLKLPRLELSHLKSSLKLILVVVGCLILVGGDGFVTMVGCGGGFVSVVGCVGGGTVAVSWWKWRWKNWVYMIGFFNVILIFEYIILIYRIKE